MEEIQRQIQVFNEWYYVCLGICIFGLILSIVLFFKFDIIHIFNTRTGRSVRKTVQQIEKINAQTEQPRNIPSHTELLPEKGTELLVQKEINEECGMFRIEKYELYIHTDEEGEKRIEKEK